jgi:hypothetical protein
MPIEELVSLKDKIPINDIPAFHKEIQRKMKNFSPLERMHLIKGDSSQYNAINMPWQDNHIQIHTKDKKNYHSHRKNNRYLYSLFDSNDDNHITVHEFYDAMSKQQIQQNSQTQQMNISKNKYTFDKIDTNHDGVISKQEFYNYQHKHKKYRKQKKQNSSMY